MVIAAGEEENGISDLPTKTFSIDKIRCINQGLGGSTEHSDKNRGCLVSSGSLQPHQLLRTTSSVPGSQGIWQVLNPPDSPAPDGQLYSSDVCKPKRGHLFPELVPTSHLHLGVVPGQEYHTMCRASPSTSQYTCGYGIKISEGSLRLDVEPNSVPEDHEPIGPARGRPVCLQVNQTTPPISTAGGPTQKLWPRMPSCKTGQSCGDLPIHLGALYTVVYPKLTRSHPPVEDTVVISSTVGIAGGLSKSPPHQTDLVVMPSDQGFLMQQGVPTLIACPISGNPSHHKDFLLRLQTSCLPHGNLKPTPTMAPVSLDGRIGASKGIGIP